MESGRSRHNPDKYNKIEQAEHRLLWYWLLLAAHPGKATEHPKGWVSQARTNNRGFCNSLPGILFKKYTYFNMQVLE